MPLNRTRTVAFVAAHLLFEKLTSGGDVLFAQIARELSKARPEWRIAVIAPAYCAADLAQYFEVILPLPESSRGTWADSPFLILPTWYRRAKQTASILKTFQPDLVHTTGDFFPDVLPAFRMKDRLNYAWSAVIHHINSQPLARRNPLLLSSASYVLQRWSFRMMRSHSDAVSLLNESTASALHALNFPADKLNVIGAGIDVDRFVPSLKHVATRRVLWVHRIEPTKGIIDLPKIIALMPEDVHFDVVGQGPKQWTDELQKRLEGAGVLSRVTLHGYAPETMLQTLFSDAAAFISCSYEEGWGLSIAEALAAGLPCVAYDLPSHQEIFGDAVDLVPIGDHAAFADRLLRVLNRSDGAANRLARRNHVLKYSFAHAALRQAEVFDSLLARP